MTTLRLIKVVKNGASKPKANMTEAFLMLTLDWEEWYYQDRSPCLIGPLYIFEVKALIAAELRNLPACFPANDVDYLNRVNDVFFGWDSSS